MGPAPGSGREMPALAKFALERGTQRLFLGLKPSRESVVPGGLGISIATFPTVETVGFLLLSHSVGLECRGLGLGSVVSCRWPVLSESKRTHPAKVRPDGAPTCKDDS